MSYTELRDFNVTGIDGMLLYVAEVVPSFIPMLLFSIFSIVLLGTYFSEKRLTGRANFPASLSVAGWLTVVIAVILSTIDNLVNIYTLAICIVVSVIGTLVLLTSEDRF